MIRYPHITEEEVSELREVVSTLDPEWRDPFMSSHLMTTSCIQNMYKAYDGDIDGTDPCPEWLPHRHWVAMRYLKVFAFSQELIDVYRPILLNLIKDRSKAPSDMHLTPFYSLDHFSECRWFPGNGTTTQLTAAISAMKYKHVPAENAYVSEASAGNTAYSKGMASFVNLISSNAASIARNWAGNGLMNNMHQWLLAYNTQNKTIYLILCKHKAKVVPSHNILLEREVDRLMRRMDALDPEEISPEIAEKIEEEIGEKISSVREEMEGVARELRDKVDDLYLMIQNRAAPSPAPSIAMSITPSPAPSPAPSGKREVIHRMIMQKIGRISKIAADKDRGMELQEDLEGLMALLETM